MYKGGFGRPFLFPYDSAPGIEQINPLLQASDASWCAGVPPAPGAYAAKTRYRQTDAPCWLQAAPKGGPLTGGGDASAVRLHFDQPQWAVTPGQSAVLYDGDVCLGGGVIDGFE